MRSSPSPASRIHRGSNGSTPATPRWPPRRSARAAALPGRGRWGEREGKRRDCLDSPVRSGSGSGADLGAEPGATSAWWSRLVSRPHGRVVSHCANGNQRGPRRASRQRRGGGKLTCQRSNSLSWYYGPSRAWRSNTGWKKKRPCPAAG